MNTIFSLSSRSKLSETKVSALVLKSLLCLVVAASLFAPTALAQNTQGQPWTMPTDEKFVKDCTAQGVLSIQEGYCERQLACVKAQSPKTEAEFAQAANKCIRDVLKDPIGTGAGIVVDAATNGLKDIGLDILIAVAYFIFSFSNFMLGIAGVLFNWVLLVTVYQFGTYFGNSQAILLAWGILRDLANIVLLFGFIFMGLQTILDIGHFNVKKALPRLLIFAILMNFSLFATEAIIDTTNVFSAVMSTQAGTGCDPKAAQGNEQCVQQGIAGKIMQNTGLSGMFHSENTYAPNTFSDKTVAAMVYVGAALFSTIGAIVLFMGALLLIIRAITLVFLMVLSPLGFAAFAVPQFEEIATKWWKTLIAQAAAAPVFILLILVSLKIAEQFQVSGGSGNQGLVAAMQAQNTSALGVILIFTIVTGFLIASMVVTKKMGVMGASFATTMAVGAVAGTAAFATRRTVGYGAAKTAQALRKTKFARSGAGRLLISGADKLGGASFDARGALGGAAKGVGLDIGKPGKGGKKGYTGIVKEEAEKSAKYAASLEQTDVEKIKEQSAANRAKYFEGELDTKKQEEEAKEKEYQNEEFNARRSMQLDLRPDQAALERQKQELDAARAAGTATPTMETAYNNNARAYEAKKDAAQSALDAELNAIKERRENDRKIFAEQKAALSAKVEESKLEEKKQKQAPQQEMADKYAGRAQGLGRLNPTLGPDVGVKAAKMIIDELKKSKTDKKLEKIEAAIEKGTKVTKEELDDLAGDLKKEDKEKH